MESLLKTILNLLLAPGHFAMWLYFKYAVFIEKRKDPSSTIKVKDFYEDIDADHDLGETYHFGVYIVSLTTWTLLVILCTNLFS